MSGGREVSQVELSEILDVSVVSLRAWERESMPVVSKGTRGRPATYNTADVIRWCEARIVAKCALAATDPTAVVSEDEARRRKIYAEAQLAELKLAIETGELVEIEAVGEELDAAFTKVRTRILAIPGALALTLTNEPNPTVIRDRVFDEISSALQELSAADYGQDTGASEAAA